MRKDRFLPRFLALFLALSLALPAGPALALRNLQPVDNAGLEEEIAQRLGRAGSEEQWQDQMWKVLAEGFDISTEELRNRLQPTDLLDFRRSFGPESIGPKIDLYARMLLGADLPFEKRQRMVEQLSMLIEPPIAYPAAVVKSYEDLSRSKTLEEFYARFEKFMFTGSITKCNTWWS